MADPTYNPGVFAVGSIEQAMTIILTPEGATTAERWRNETGYLVDLMESRLKLDSGSVVLDYGCGIGRIAKELIRRTQCTVLGVDISPEMRVLAPQYVQSDLFSACSPEVLDSLTQAGLNVDAAISIWVLQHCLQPAIDIARVQDAVRPRGSLFLVNNERRAVPTVAHGWMDDGLNIKQMLSEAFVPGEEGLLDVEKTTPKVAQHCYWAHFRKRAGSTP
jgi:cyclopropane fatty-acyl-phospholipid synthase-like methyltransferase